MMKTLTPFLFIFIFACSSPSKKIEEQQGVNTEIILKEQNSPTKSSIRGISVLSEDLAWLSGSKGSIVRTVDGGSTWDLIPAPDTDSLGFRSIHAFNSNEAIVASAGFPARIYKTKDAGINWKLVYENHDSAAFMNSIAFKSPTEGLVFGDQLNGRHLLLETKDAGESWNQIDSSLIPTPLAIENGFAASGSCIAIGNKGDYYIALGGEAVRVFSFVNEKWHAHQTPMHSGGGSKGAYSIAYGAGRLMAVGGDYLEVDSSRYPIISNNGIEWEKTKSPVPGYRSVVDYCEKEKMWFVAGTNGIDYTTDNGENWVTFSDEDINTLRFAPNSSKAFISNKDGKIFTLNILH